MGLYLNFVKKVTCLLKQYGRNFTPVCRITCQRVYEWCIKVINEHYSQRYSATLQDQKIFSRQNKKYGKQYTVTSN